MMSIIHGLWETWPPQPHPVNKPGSGTSGAVPRPRPCPRRTRSPRPVASRRHRRHHRRRRGGPAGGLADVLQRGAEPTFEIPRILVSRDDDEAVVQSEVSLKGLGPVRARPRAGPRPAAQPGILVELLEAFREELREQVEDGGGKFEHPTVRAVVA